MAREQNPWEPFDDELDALGEQLIKVRDRAIDHIVETLTFDEDESLQKNGRQKQRFVKATVGSADAAKAIVPLVPQFVDEVLGKLLTAICFGEIEWRTRTLGEEFDVRQRGSDSMGNCVCGHLGDWVEYHSTRPRLDWITRPPRLLAPRQTGDRPD
jgi:hypothetical protein